MARKITERNVFLTYVYFMLTFGLYGFYWVVSTKRDINARGGDIPTTWLMLVPFVNFYYAYKYCDNFATKIKKNDSGPLYFVMWIFIGFVMPGIVQSALNKVANSEKTPFTPRQQQAA